ncbi:trehalose-phosphatase [Natronomonas salina]|uniref:trehalose-phosphatase n=1 Tax=Natronomonas salina TaxID=1710540 RepID=UPI001FE8C3A2|nr:trehalose-phosphatase [Natronomonas salina]
MTSVTDDSDDRRSGGDEDELPLLGNWLSLLEDRLSGAERLALCLDFDGTLAPIVEDPDAAAMPERTAAALEELAGHPGVDLAVVSGRGLEDLRERVAVDDCVLAGNHGLEIDRGGDRWTHPEVDPEALDRVRETVAERVESIDGCHVEDKRLTATVHFRRADVGREEVRPLVQSAVDDVSGFEATDGRQIVEIRPSVEWDKGEAVRELVDDRALGIYVGDDTTDEDAFEALEDLPGGGVGILVGDRPSAAEFRVHDVDGVRAFLEWLADGHGPVDGADADGSADA